MRNPITRDEARLYGTFIADQNEVEDSFWERHGITVLSLLLALSVSPYVMLLLGY